MIVCLLGYENAILIRLLLSPYFVLSERSFCVFWEFLNFLAIAFGIECYLQLCDENKMGSIMHGNWGNKIKIASLEATLQAKDCYKNILKECTWKLFFLEARSPPAKGGTFSCVNFQSFFNKNLSSVFERFLLCVHFCFEI